ncbi:MAG: hypothetical protein LBP87_07270 [Planctomycetaceae bacterium]|nr:hypothetical protein [Planctomycetaceae bacterium]
MNRFSLFEVVLRLSRKNFVLKSFNNLSYKEYFMQPFRNDVPVHGKPNELTTG